MVLVVVTVELVVDVDPHGLVEVKHCPLPLPLGSRVGSLDVHQAAQGIQEAGNAERYVRDVYEVAPEGLMFVEQ